MEEVIGAVSAIENMPRVSPDAAPADHTPRDKVLREAVQIANVPTLLVLLAQLTDDDRWLRAPYRPSKPRGNDDNDSGGLPPEVQDEVRAAALAAFLDARERGVRSARHVADDPDRLVELLGAAMGGEEIPSEYGPMIAATLAPDTSQARRRDWRGRSAVIIGAGISGLAAAMQLDRLGLPYVVVDRQREVGGSWMLNRYPGAGVDVPSHLYEFGSLPNDWGHYFATRDEVHDYLRQVADTCDLTGRLRLDTTVESMRFDEATRCWEVRTRTDDGSVETLRADFVISAVGAFNQPSVPDLPGLDEFTGEVFHTTRWPDVDLSGRRVAVIGNGASAMQVVPAIAPEVEHLTVVQRSPHWVSPFPKLHQPVPAPLRRLMELVPDYRAWYKLRLSWTYMDKLHPVLHRDPTWPHPERAVNAKNDAQRAFFTAYIESELADRPDLVEQLVPRYPPYGKRLLMDNGWYAALRRDNVTLETSGEARFTPDSLLVNGHEHPVDIVVLATGFRVVRFLSTFDVTGRDGVTLDDVWGDDDSRAYLGLAVPDFPNLFILYGPNVQPGHGGSLVATVEAQMDYLAALLGEAHDRGIETIEVRREAHDWYVESVDAAHEQMIWTHPGMDTYYRNSAGRVVVSNPFRIIDFWEQTRRVNWNDWC